MSNVKKNFIYNTIYHIFLIILPLITTPYISRILGPEQIGVFSYHYSIAVLFGVFAMLGLNNYGNRTIAFNKDKKKKLSKTFMGIYGVQIASSTLAIIAYIFYASFIDSNIISWIMLIYVVSSLFDISWFLFGLEEFRIATIRSSIVKIIMTLLIFIFVKTPNDLSIYSIIISSSALISQLCLWPFAIKRLEKTKIKKEIILKHIKPTLILFIPVIAINIYRYMDKVMLGAMSAKAEVGYYESSDKIINVPMALINSLGAVMLPRTANLLSSGNTQKAMRYMEKSIAFAALFSTLLGAGIMAVSRSFIPVFYGSGFEKCEYLFYILMPSCVFLAFANVIRTQYLIPAKKDKIYVTSVIIGAITNLIVNALLIPKLDSIGAAIGTLLAQAMVCVYQAICVRKVLPIKKYISRTIPYVIMSIIMFIFVRLISDSIQVSNSYIKLLIDITLGVITYIPIIFLFSIITKHNYLLISIKTIKKK